MVDAMNLWDGAMVYLGQLLTGNSMVASDLGENGVVKSMFAQFFTNTVLFGNTVLAKEYLGMGVGGGVFP